MLRYERDVVDGALAVFGCITGPIDVFDWTSGLVAHSTMYDMHTQACIYACMQSAMPVAVVYEVEMKDISAGKTDGKLDT